MWCVFPLPRCVNHKKEKQGLGNTNVEFTSPDSLSVFRFSNSKLILPNSIVWQLPPQTALFLSDCIVSRFYRRVVLRCNCYICYEINATYDSKIPDCRLIIIRMTMKEILPPKFWEVPFLTSFFKVQFYP